MAELSASQRNKLAQDAINICKPLNLSNDALFAALKELNNPDVNALLEKSGITKEQLELCGNELKALEEATTVRSVSVQPTITPAVTAPTTIELDPALKEEQDKAAAKDAALKAEFDKAIKGADARTIKAATAQLELKRTGLYEGKIDGEFGKSTRDALGKVTAENTNPALSNAIGALDAKDGYNKNNQDAINSAKAKVSPAAEVSAGEKSTAPAPKVDAVTEREAKIKAAQTELAKGGFYGDEAKAKPESVADGKIGTKTALAMVKANEAVVKETANGKDCPPALKGAAEALVTLKDIQGTASPAKTPEKPSQASPEKPVVAAKPSTEKPLDIKSRTKSVRDEDETPVRDKPKHQPKVQPRREPKQERPVQENDLARPVSGPNAIEIEAAVRLNGKEWREKGANGRPALDPYELERRDPKAFAAMKKQIAKELNAVTTGEKQYGDVMSHTGRKQFLGGTVPDVRENGVVYVGLEGRDDLRQAARSNPVTNTVGNHQLHDEKAEPVRRGKNWKNGNPTAINTELLRADNGKLIFTLGGGRLVNETGDPSGPGSTPNVGGRGGGGGGKGGGGPTG